ncbi:hypothetical protein FOA43_001802 [Brettanomyces nanus]|uniref:Protein HID1 n=1 Tax=Eeniella nana TaxID=13502 RepID=A0A875S336_EENNA|nr:uncharacterized protein FOA43_001802 [Brettanomyces nanus]QPG74472.1 hypothetical protein FOA43_001802 [Brettanomyces nanus]
MSDQHSFRSLLFHLSDVTVKAPISDTSFWSIYWSSPTSANQIFSALTPHEIRYLRDSNLHNYTSFLHAVASHFVHLASSSKSPLATFPTRHLLNSARILTKFLPYLYEIDTLAPLEKNLFWSLNYAPNDDPGSSTTDATVGSASSHFSSSNDISSHDSTNVLVDFNKNSADSGDSTNVRFDDQSDSFILPLGAQLVNSITKLLFVSTFTTPSPAGNPQQYMNMQDFTLWEAGVGGKNDGRVLDDRVIFDHVFVDLDSHRLELLRLLLCLCSQCLYLQVPTVVPQGSRYLTWLVSCTDKLTLLSLLSSLINVTCRSTRENVSSLTSNENGLSLEVPLYKDLRTLYVTHCIQLLTLMLVYPIPRDDVVFLKRYMDQSMSDKPINLARYYCGRLYKPTEISVLKRGLVDCILRPVDGGSTATTSFSNWMKTKLISNDPLIWSSELLMLFWEFYQVNKKFRSVVTCKYGPKLLMALLYNVWTNKMVDKQRNTVRLSLYLILFLMSDPQMSCQLLMPIDKKFYSEMPQNYRLSVAPTTYRDFLVSQLCNITCSECPTSLYPILVQLVYNLVPLAALYIDKEAAPTENRRLSQRDLVSGLTPPRELSYAASSSLVQLVNKLSGVGFLSANPIHPDLLALVIRSICHSFCRVPQHSTLLLYVITKSRGVFNNVSTGICELSDRRQQQQQQKQQPPQQQPATQQPPQPQSGINISDIDSRTSANHSRDSFSSPVPPPFNRRESELSTVSSQYSQSADELIESLTLAESRGSECNEDLVSSVRVPSAPGATETSESPETPEYPSSEHVNSPEIDPLDEDLLKSRLPVGMSEHAKSKQPLFASLESTWSGKQALKTILQVTEYICDHVTINPSVYDTSGIVNRIAALEIDKFIAQQHVIDEYDPEKTSFDPLRFSWSPLSLGWYEAVLWASIYSNYNVVGGKKLLTEISTSIKRIGWGLWGNNSTDDSMSSSSSSDGSSSLSSSRLDDSQLRSVAQSSMTHSGIWSGTFIHLFHVKIPVSTAQRASQTSVDAISDGINAGVGYRRHF